MRRKALIILGVFLCLFCFWFFYLRTEREKRLEKEGNEIIRKIEEFRNENGKLPKSLEEIGVNILEGADALDYTIYKDSINYTISFVISIDNSKIYYSDTKGWEDFYREIEK